MDWNTAQRILCVRLDSLGDVLMTTPAMAAIKASRPGCHLTLMTSAAGAAIAPQLPMVDEVWVYDAPWLKATAPRETSQPEHDMLAELRRRRFDAAIIFTVYSQNPLPTATMAYLADIPLRLAHCRENPYQLLTDHIPEPEPELSRHEVQRQLDLVASVGYTNPDSRLRLTVPTLAQQRITTLLGELGLSPQPTKTPRPARDPVGAQHAVPLPIGGMQETNSDQPWIVIHPGASAPSRRYPPELFAQVARSLVQSGLTVLFTGTPPERDLVESIRDQMDAPSYSLVGLLDLKDLSALLAAAPLLLSNNTGPVHIAAAVGTPVVDLYALTNLQHTPWQVPHQVLFHDVPCRLCYKSICPEGHHACLRQVEPQAVVAAVLELLFMEQFKLEHQAIVAKNPLAKNPVYSSLI
ncbi:glycosyltransferase family 9 protein [Nodosilinea sp. LEGE 06152]|uniref:glycosyltransferase family 9 protein n=1 Tax=Nodosilinea sp. LEGE 06152 TaxID=2777966 RepID=UPI001880A957|nr:glycosyltransferase family 9 protein [Nodosilinea sp. LEGE 06152]MBE9159305.1 glycosyltransferase family 9 protein [Nodosilinea sp. LEGE 06152]